MMVTTTVRPILVCLLLVTVLLSSGCIGKEQALMGQAAPEFRSETTAYDDRVEFRYIPDSDEPGTYSVTCTIERNVSWGTEIETRESVRYVGVSRAGPIEFVVPREGPLDSVALEIEIRSAAGVFLHWSRTSMAPAMPVPTPP